MTTDFSFDCYVHELGNVMKIELPACTVSM